MEVSIDPANFSYQHGFYLNTSNYSSNSASTSPSDLLGFCNNSFDSKEFSYQRQYPNYPTNVASYPSPPPTSSDPKRNVPLPSLSTGVRRSSFGGILDSPLVNHATGLVPISPPATVPTPTLPLPWADGDFASDESDRLDFATLKVDQEALLSPLSPEWGSSSIEDLDPTSRSDGIVLLSSSHGTNHGYYHRDQLWAGSSSQPGGSEDGDSTGNIRPQPSAYDAEEPISFLPPLPPFPRRPSSPSLMDISEPPDSPSWSPSSLPELEMDDGDSDNDTLLTPPSPSSKSLSLPGAEFEDDFFDGHMAWSGSESDFLQTREETSLSTPKRNQGLLLIDDANDVPTPRSPSPDNFDLDASIYASCSDPDVARLVALRRKSQIAERFAKEVEERSLSQSSMFVRAEARKKRKKEKERVKEITAMLRLKLETNLSSNEDAGSDSPGGNGNRRCRCPSPEVKRVKAKKGISSIPQLVARMTFRRRDGSDRPITHMPAPPKPKPSSPLSRSWGVDDEDSDEDSDDDMALDDSIMGLKGFDDLSSPQTLPTTTDAWAMMIDEESEQ